MRDAVADCLLDIGFERLQRGEAALLGSLARTARNLLEGGARPARLAQAHCLVGDVLQAQGKLAEAQAAFEEYLRISRQLAAQAPANAGWQRDLAVACVWIGHLEQRLGHPHEAVPFFEEVDRVFARLFEIAPAQAQWQKERAQVAAELAVARQLAARTSPGGDSGTEPSPPGGFHSVAAGARPRGFFRNDHERLAS